MSAPAETTRTGTRPSFLDRFFRYGERGSSLRIEALGGFSTFLTMSYILFVNPAILSAAGLPFNAVATATALAAAIATLAMGLIANYPFALASGLGLNAVVAFDVILGRHLPWQTGMAVVVIEGLVAVVLVAVGAREAVMRAIPNSLKLSIGVGIGLFITLVGLREGGIVVNNPATGIGLGDLTTGPAEIALLGIFVAGALAVRGVRGALLIGVATSAFVGMVFGVLDWPNAVAHWPNSSDFSTIGDSLSHIGDALTLALIPVIFSLFMTDFFDTLGTAYGLGEAAGAVDEKGELPRIGPVLMVDSAAAALGGTMGVSSVTTYVESGAGVEEGARTGLASVVTGLLFALAIFFVPVMGLVGQDVQVAKGVFIHPAIAPAMVIVGYMMMRLVQVIDWTDPEVAFPAFLLIAGIPLTFSISAGIGFGVIGHVVVKVAKGKAREVSWLMYALVPLFLAFYASGWLEQHVF
ncbi:MAG TPA: NCS2 family permease [Thermoleophilaceae bacterium]|jgi:AGZA family xanthine/uracil permease-like MFS transporter|nr:NCS2 family permease [Thermoleophilaceae bacterium]